MSAASPDNGGMAEASAASHQEVTLKQLAGVQWNSASGNPPAYPESTEQAHARYTAALEAIADRHAGQNVLVVTHGEAVRRSVARLVRIPGAILPKKRLV